MFIRCSLLLLFLSCVRTTENKHADESASDFNKFSLWPSYHNAANLLRSRRALPVQTVEDRTGADATEIKNDKPPADSIPPAVEVPSKELASDIKEGEGENNKETKSETSQTNIQIEAAVSVPGKTTDATTVTPPQITELLNVTTTEKPKVLDLNNPGVVKRGIIVFGGFALMAVAYFIFYRRKNKNNDNSTSIGMNDSNQFRYGVLQNEDMKDNIEASRVPLTMDSEDEVDDDLEIFDLVQKKKSLSYVNLQQNDEDIVLNTREVDIEGDNLLLDIEVEDESNDTLINWSNNGNRTIF